MHSNSYDDETPYEPHDSRQQWRDADGYDGYDERGPSRSVVGYGDGDDDGYGYGENRYGAYGHEERYGSHEGHQRNATSDGLYSEDDDGGAYAAYSGRNGHDEERPPGRGETPERGSSSSFSSSSPSSYSAPSVVRTQQDGKRVANKVSASSGKGIAKGDKGVGNPKAKTPKGTKPGPPRDDGDGHRNAPRPGEKATRAKNGNASSGTVATGKRDQRPVTATKGDDAQAKQKKGAASVTAAAAKEQIKGTNRGNGGPKAKGKGKGKQKENEKGKGKGKGKAKEKGKGKGKGKNKGGHDSDIDDPRGGETDPQRLLRRRMRKQKAMMKNDQTFLGHFIANLYALLIETWRIFYDCEKTDQALRDYEDLVIPNPRLQARVCREWHEKMKPHYEACSKGNLEVLRDIDSKLLKDIGFKEKYDELTNPEDYTPEEIQDYVKKYSNYIAEISRWATLMNDVPKRMVNNIQNMSMKISDRIEDGEGLDYLELGLQLIDPSDPDMMNEFVQNLPGIIDAVGGMEPIQEAMSGSNTPNATGIMNTLRHLIEKGRAGRGQLDTRDGGVFGSDSPTGDGQVDGGQQQQQQQQDPSTHDTRGAIDTHADTVKFGWTPRG